MEEQRVARSVHIQRWRQHTVVVAKNCSVLRDDVKQVAANSFDGLRHVVVRWKETATSSSVTSRTQTHRNQPVILSVNFFCETKVEIKQIINARATPTLTHLIHTVVITIKSFKECTHLETTTKHIHSQHDHASDSRSLKYSTGNSFFVSSGKSQAT